MLPVTNPSVGCLIPDRETHQFSKMRVFENPDSKQLPETVSSHNERSCKHQPTVSVKWVLREMKPSWSGWVRTKRSSEHVATVRKVDRRGWGQYIQGRSQHSETEPMGSRGENWRGAEGTNCSHVCMQVFIWRSLPVLELCEIFVFDDCPPLF
jgi:hypothetical protein